jgi:Barrel-sandwich domain of CusB or HlyD membrane-fusion
MSRKSTVYLAVIILLASGILGFWLYRSSRSVALAAAAEKDLLTVTRADFPLIATAPGILESPRSVSIGPPRVPRENRFRLARMVEEGKHVSEGDFLLEFDGSELNRRLREDTANFQRVQEEYQKKRSDFDIQVRDLKLQLEQAKADLEKLENKLSRQAELESAIVIAETQIRRDMARKKVELLAKKLDFVTDGGRVDLQISRTNENHYRSRMDTLLDAIESLTVTSPVAGVVIYKRDWNNEPRQVGNYVFVLDTVLEIPDLSSMRAKVMVDEVDAGKVQVGQEAQVLVDALQGRAFSGKVTSISAILKQAAFDRPQRIAEALVELQSSEIKQLRPGMSARAQIQVGRHSDVVVIPLSSIQERNGHSLVQVWNVEKLTYDWQPVQLLTNDGVSAVISSGLQAGQRIRATPKG